MGPEGVKRVSEEDYLAADRPEAMIDALVSWIPDLRRALAMAERSRGFVLDGYDAIGWPSGSNRSSSPVSIAQFVPHARTRNRLYQTPFPIVGL